MLDNTWFEDWRRVRAETEAVAERMPEDRLDFRPHPDLMHLGELARHIVGACYFILSRGLGREVATPEPIKSKTPMTGTELRKELQRTDELVRTTLSDFSEEDLKMTNSSGKPKREVLRHLMEHEIHHRAQLKMYLKILGL